MTATKKNAGIVKLATNRYEIRVRATCPRTGRRKEERRVRDCSLTEARALQHQWQDDLDASLQLAPNDRQKQRLRDFVPSWLAGRKGDIKGTTARKIATVWDLQIEPTKIASLYIDEITIEDVEEWIAAMRTMTYLPGRGRASERARKSKAKARVYSAGTVKGYYRVLAQILKIATARANVRNPCDAIERIKPGKRRKNYLEAAEIAGVLAHVREHSPDWYVAVLLDVVSGLRWGELSALRWDDLDEAQGVIRVCRNNDKGTMVQSTKTGNDEDEPRIVPLLPEVADVLRARRKKMVADQHPGLIAGWIFPTERGTLHKGSPLRDVLDAACTSCGTRRITPHGLRHTANDLLRRVAKGEVVRAIIGHSTVAMTHHYSHVDEGEKRTASTRVLDVVLAAKGVEKGVDQHRGGIDQVRDTSQLC